MLITKRWIEKNYDKFNEEFFGGLLPNIQFNVNRSKNSWGFASYKYDYKNDTIIPQAITLSNYYDSPEKVKLNTLLHEMIHIADYTLHPEHFIKNGHRVSGHRYDAHGWWFQNEAKRIEKFGWIITKHITKEEEEVSKLSISSERCLARRKNDAILCVVRGTTGMNFYFKTDIYKIKIIKSTIKKYRFYHIGDIRKIEFYTFDDIELSSRRSCGKRLSGWFANNKELMNKLENIKATTVKY